MRKATLLGRIHPAKAALQQLPFMAQRGQATCPQHHPCGSVPANMLACSFTAKSHSNLCYTLRERATFLAPAQLQLILRTFKSF